MSEDYAGPRTTTQIDPETTMRNLIDAAVSQSSLIEGHERDIKQIATGLSEMVSLNHRQHSEVAAIQETLADQQVHSIRTDLVSVAQIQDVRHRELQRRLEHLVMAMVFLVGLVAGLIVMLAIR